jgi:hypothetical protein
VDGRRPPVLIRLFAWLSALIERWLDPDSQ